MKGLAPAHPFVRWMLPAVALSAVVAARSGAAAAGGWSSYSGQPPRRIMTTAAVARGSIWVACNRPSAAALDPLATDPKAPYFDWSLHRPPSYTDIFRPSAASGRTVWRRRVPGRDLRGADRGRRRSLRPQHHRHLPRTQRAQRPHPLEDAPRRADRRRARAAASSPTPSAANSSRPRNRVCQHSVCARGAEVPRGPGKGLSRMPAWVCRGTIGRCPGLF